MLEFQKWQKLRWSFVVTPSNFIVQMYTWFAVSISWKPETFSNSNYIWFPMDKIKKYCPHTYQNHLANFAAMIEIWISGIVIRNCVIVLFSYATNFTVCFLFPVFISIFQKRNNLPQGAHLIWRSTFSLLSLTHSGQKLDLNIYQKLNDFSRTCPF